MEHIYNLIPLILLIAGGAAILTFEDLRFDLAGLGAVYLAAFLLIVQSASPSLAITKLVTGLMAAGVIYVSRNDIPQEQAVVTLASRVFKITALALIWLATFIISANLNGVFPLNYETIAGALVCFSGGLIVLGTSRNALKVTLGILLIYTGFDVLYTPLENSVLINGLLSLITMLIALVGVYISTRHESEYEE